MKTPIYTEININYIYLSRRQLMECLDIGRTSAYTLMTSVDSLAQEGIYPKMSVIRYGKSIKYVSKYVIYHYLYYKPYFEMYQDGILKKSKLPRYIISELRDVIGDCYYIEKVKERLDERI